MNKEEIIKKINNIVRELGPIRLYEDLDKEVIVNEELKYDYHIYIDVYEIDIDRALCESHYKSTDLNMCYKKYQDLDESILIKILECIK